MVRLIAGSASDPGEVRPNNEDAHAVLLPPEVPSGIEALLVVADGMGGHQAGETASAMVIEQLRQSVGKDTAPTAPEDGWTERLGQLIRHANETVWQAAEQNAALQGMGTTATAAIIADGQLYVGHVGDSRLYLLREGEIRQLTSDHTWVAEQMRHGLLTADQARNDARRNVLMRAVGGAPMVEVDVQTRTIKAGDCLLLCTDGLSNLVADDDLKRVVQTYGQPGLAAQELIRIAKQRGAPDNVTAIVARVVNQTDDKRRTLALDSATRPASRRRRRGARPNRAMVRIMSILLLAIFVVTLTMILQNGKLINWAVAGALLDTIRNLTGR